MISSKKNLPMGLKNYSTSQILISGGHVKGIESLYTQVIIWVNSILNHIDSKAVLPRYEGSCMMYRPK